MRMHNGQIILDLPSFIADIKIGHQNSINKFDTDLNKKILSNLLESVSNKFDSLEKFYELEFLDKVKEQLNNYNNINDILTFGINYIISFPTEIKKRIEYLIHCADEEIEIEYYNEDEQNALTNNLKKSLINCLYFLIKLENFKEPEITLHPDFYFCLEWEINKTNCIILQFYPNDKVQYLFFTPNPNLENQRNVMQGFTDINKIFNLLENLKLDTYKTGLL